MVKDFESDEAEIDRIAREVISLEYYLRQTLPHAEKSLTGILGRVKTGQIGAEEARVRAVICRSAGQCALLRYPNDPTVQDYNRRLEIVYSEIESYFQTN